MGKNDLKPNHSSSEEEEEDDDEVTSGSESDEGSDTDSGEKTLQLPKNARISPQSANKTQPPDPPSSEEEEEEEAEESDSGADSDSDSPPKTSAVVDRNVKPISSVPTQSKSLKSDGSKTVSTPPPAKNKRPALAPAAVEKDAKKPKQSTVNGKPKKPVAVPDPALSEEVSSDSDTDSDSPPKTSAVANSSIKPISSKPIEREAQNLASKSAKKSPAKSKQPPSTPAPETSEKDIKKGKKTTATDDDTKKQLLFQRLWSEDDEIAVLQGMIDFKTERNGENPVADPDAFHDFIRKSLHVDFTRTQLMDKIRRLKKKYVNNASKEKKNGKDRHFTKSHEQKAYDLSKLIWESDGKSNNNTKGKEVKKNQSKKNGNLKAAGTPASTSTVATDTGINAGDLLKSNGVDDKDKLKKGVELEKKIDISRLVQYGLRNDSSILSEEIVKAGMELVEESKREELEAKWKVLMEQELELYVKRMELLKEQALVVLDAVKSSGN